MVTFETTAAGYLNMWKIMRVTRHAACEAAARKILSLKERYIAVERLTGVPWFWVGITHMREASNNFAGVLHNGEKIIGTGLVTRLVPQGRGPFRSWEEAAVDALRLKGLHKVNAWSIARMGYEFERYNGFGYMGKHNSPYVWSGSNLYESGKYTSDHHYDAHFVDPQLGCLPVLAVLCEISEEVRQRVDGNIVPVPAPALPPVQKPAPAPAPAPVGLLGLLVSFFQALFGKRKK